jgi:uncharacterized lipoprotein YddW (UPF0748 family)
MDRREFLVGAAAAGASMALGEPVMASEGSSSGVKMGRGKYWAWTHVDPKATTFDLKERYAALKKHGLSGVFINGVDDREFEIIREAGMEVHAWMWTTNRGDQWIRDNHPDWYQVSRTGKSCFDQPPYVDYYRWISPVIPGVQRYLEDQVGQLASHAAVQGVHLDYVRYPDVILPRGLWEKYHLDQTEEMAEYDFCYSPHTREAFKKVSGRDPMEIADPSSDQEWLHFRYDSVTNLVKKLTNVAHDHGKAITAAVFPTPSRARMICRQDWDKWPLDAACPMIYHSFYNRAVDFIGECMIENIHAVRFPIYAGLYMPAFETPEEFRQGLQLVKKRGGAGVSLFGGVGDPFWKVFEEELGH